MSIRLKTILGIALIEIVFLSLLLWLSLDYLRTTNKDQLQGRAHATAHLLGIAIKNAKQVNSTTSPTPTSDPTIALGMSRLGSPTSSARVLALSKPRKDQPANMTATTKGLAMNAVSDGQVSPLPRVVTLLTE